MASAPVVFSEHAPAKINLTLRICGRRADGYHQLESLVVFAQLGDRLELTPGRRFALTIEGPFAAALASPADNLIAKAATALAGRIPGLRSGRFTLIKQLPVAAGLGGGSADAAAALRLLAKINDLDLGDPRLRDAARATGADVPVCLDPRPRLMQGIGEQLSAPLRLAALPCVLVNPGVALGTAKVFANFDLHPARTAAGPCHGGDWRLALAAEPPLAVLRSGHNDLEAAAIRLVPEIAEVLELLGETNGCALARMSGSGASCFGLFHSAPAAQAAASLLAAARPHWWVRATTLNPAGCDD